MLNHRQQNQNRCLRCEDITEAPDAALCEECANWPPDVPLTGRCLGCNTPIDDASDVLCAECDKSLYDDFRQHADRVAHGC